MVNYIKKTYEYGNNVRTALKNLKAVDTNPWRPSMQASVGTDTAAQALESKQFEINSSQSTTSNASKSRAAKSTKLRHMHCSGSDALEE